MIVIDKLDTHAREGKPMTTTPHLGPDEIILDPFSLSLGRDSYLLHSHGHGCVCYGGLGFDFIKESAHPKFGHKSTIKHAQERAST
jgi:hypothetical protein